MKYRATKLGFYIGRRRPGDVFEGPKGLSGSWFEPVADDAPVAAAKREIPKKETPVPLSSVRPKAGKGATADHEEIDLA